MTNTAFSLIELLVVIAITAVLAAIAIPAYQAYSIRAKLLKARPYIDSTIQALETRYNTTGSFAGNFTIGNTVRATYSNGVTFAVTGAGPIVTADYRDPTLANSFCTITKSASFAVWITGLEGIPGYVAPVAGGVSTNSGIYVRIYADPQGILHFVCGKHLSSHTASMDLEYSKYLGCTETDVSSFACP